MIKALFNTLIYYSVYIPVIGLFIVMLCVILYEDDPYGIDDKFVAFSNDVHAKATFLVQLVGLLLAIIYIIITLI